MAHKFQMVAAAGMVAVATTLGLALDRSPPAQAASPIEALAGYWSGMGSVALSSGKSERVKCAVTYKISGSGSQIKQNMRCASPDYKIEAAADLRVHGSNVTGNWEEKTYSANGQVSGRVAGSNFNLSIKGAAFSAALSLNTTECKQTISITPQGLDVTRIHLSLAKC